MKRVRSILILILMLFVCMSMAGTGPDAGADPECFLCGMNEGSLMSLYRGRNSLGILCTDRFSVLDIYAGEGNAEEGGARAGESGMRMVFRGESRGTVTVAESDENGKCEVFIELGEKDKLNLNDLQGKLCEACTEKFERMQQENGEGLADVFLVDLANAEVYPLGKSRSFFVGDYFVIVAAEEEKIAVTVVHAM